MEHRDEWNADDADDYDKSGKFQRNMVIKILFNLTKSPSSAFYPKY